MYTRTEIKQGKVPLLYPLIKYARARCAQKIGGAGTPHSPVTSHTDHARATVRAPSAESGGRATRPRSTCPRRGACAHKKYLQK